MLDGGYAYVAFIQNASITYAFYYLVLFYLALHDFLAPYNPTLKFICIKSVLFLSFWQGVVVAGFAQFNLLQGFWIYTTDDVETGIQNLLLCFEMLLAAIAHRWAFSYEEYEGGVFLRVSTVL